MGHARSQNAHLRALSAPSGGRAASESGELLVTRLRLRSRLETKRQSPGFSERADKWGLDRTSASEPYFATEPQAPASHRIICISPLAIKGPVLSTTQAADLFAVSHGGMSAALR